MTDATRAWNARFMALTEAPANVLQAAVYSSVLHYLKAVERVGTDDGKVVAAAGCEVLIDASGIDAGRRRRS